MAPVEPSALSRANTLPLVTFAAHIAVVAALTGHVLVAVRRAARSLPASSSTRTQQTARRRHAAVFAALALLSLAAVTTFGVAWRVLSYFEWAELGNHEVPNGLWTGWYGTGQDGVGNWKLGDWTADVDLLRYNDLTVVGEPEGFLYTCQHFVGLAAASIFMGIEGHRRKFDASTIASFVLLSTLGSLGYALNLFFILILFKPFTVHGEDSPRRDALFAPKPAVYYVPVTAAVGLLWYLPRLIDQRANVDPVRFGYVVLPLFLAFAPKIIPLSWGHEHVSKAVTHRSHAPAFLILGLASSLLYWNQLTTTFLVNTPLKHSSAYDLFTNAIGKKDATNRFLTGLGTTAQKLKTISYHPAVSATASDTVFTALSLCAWAFIRNLDINAILESSPLYFLAPNHQHYFHRSKHVAFSPEPKVEKSEGDPVPAITPRKRGRPKKTEYPASARKSTTPPPGSTLAITTNTGTLRRSSRRKQKSDYESDMEESYEPPSSVSSALKQTEADGVVPTEDYVQGGESTALAIFLFVTGGLGQVAAAILGAEVTGV
ncbi:hypothetical protein P154DRAFT_251698 [Amniculicola lignicola CBS 123094]|uniref:Uncharacterized protein n=1 Tax=Amniculicola lignicola CBS 123094 TaxID=1392246 RepID=A0A6A5WGV5_9PLEO|nr:hypothetical protein P154DRAFT_251698 [Amniculicola lignicola CBS 123094]